MKLAYDWLRSTSPKVHWSKLVWSSSSPPPKMSFILWLALNAKLPTKDRILYMELDPKCELCGADLESHWHLFFKCSFSSAVWNQIKAWLGLHCCMSSLASAAKWLKKETKGTSWISKLKRLGFITCVYFIWKTRNSKIFENIIPNVDHVVFWGKTYVYRVLLALYPSFLTHISNP